MAEAAHTESGVRVRYELWGVGQTQEGEREKKKIISEEGTTAANSSPGDTVMMAWPRQGR